MQSLGVFPVYNLSFKIGTKGKASKESDMKEIADMESFEISIDGGVQDWTSMTTRGWGRSLMTSKKFKVSLKGKRNVGDPGNDYVAGVAWKDGLDCSTKASVDFPDGATLVFDCVLDVKSIYGGDSTSVAPLEFDMVGDGKPEYTPGDDTEAGE
jgi:hypothetical protein